MIKMEKKITSTSICNRLSPHTFQYWKRNNYFKAFTKATGIILLWNFSSSLTYNLILHPSSILQLEYIKDAMTLMGLTSAIFLLSPFAGYIADVKASRFKTLLCSGYIMTIFTIFIMVAFIVLTCTGHFFNSYFEVLIVTFFTVLFLFCCGRVFFLANILQFGTDQLRDVPTQCSVFFLYAFLWSDSASDVLVLSTNIPGHEIFIGRHKSTISIDRLKVGCFVLIFCASILSSVFILFLLSKNKDWFHTDNTGENPYRLVTNVIVFAARHKVPIRRSAFTFCENERLSRIDFGKQRYGGPYTTEQVEDVKVFLNVMKVIFSMGPAFMLDIVATISSINHPNRPDFRAQNPTKLMFLDYGLLSPLFTLVCIPIHFFLLKPFLSRLAPSMFKRIGLSIALLIASFSLYLLCGTVSYATSVELGNVYDLCQTNASYTLSKSILHIPATYMFIIQHIILSVSHMLLHIGAWEFICCQSPQHMKGVLFGLFFAIRALFQFLGIALLFPFIFAWKSHILKCQFGCFVFNILVGLCSLMLYTVVALKYKYRKRDDICNIYQYAEDYYTKYNSTGFRPVP